MSHQMHVPIVVSQCKLLFYLNTKPYANETLYALFNIECRITCAFLLL